MSDQPPLIKRQEFFAGKHRRAASSSVLAFFALNADTEPHFAGTIRNATKLPSGSLVPILKRFVELEIITRALSTEPNTVPNPTDEFRPVYALADDETRGGVITYLLSAYLPKSQRPQF